MATTCYIGKTQADGTVRAIFCASDGYPHYPGIGSNLQCSWMDAAKIDGLIAAGDVEYLGCDLSESRKGFCSDGTVTFYDIAEYAAVCEGRVEFVYLFAQDAWFLLHETLPCVMSWVRVAELPSDARMATARGRSQLPTPRETK